MASSRCSGAGMCAASIPESVSPSSGRPARVDEGAAEARPGRQHQHGRPARAAHALRLGDAAHVAVVADDERNRAGRRARPAPPRRPCARRSRRSCPADSAIYRKRRSAGKARESPGPRRRPRPTSDRSRPGNRTPPQSTPPPWLPAHASHSSAAAATWWRQPSRHAARPRPSRWSRHHRSRDTMLGHVFTMHFPSPQHQWSTPACRAPGMRAPRAPLSILSTLHLHPALPLHPGS